MMVSVKESERLLLENQEKSIDQLEVFGQIVELPMLVEEYSCVQSSTYIVENDQLSSPAATVSTNCWKDTLSDQGWEELLNEQSQ